MSDAALEAAAVVAGEIACERAVAEGGEMQECLCLAAELDLFGVGDVETGAVEADVGADIPGCTGG